MKKRQQDDYLFSYVIDQYLDSEKFQTLQPASQIAWKRELLLAQRYDILGGINVYELRPALIQAFLDSLTKKPGKQRNARAALQAVEKWALRRDLLPRQITTGVEVTGKLGGHKPWTDEQVTLVEQHTAKPLIARAVTLAANTGQRGSDLVRMGWGDLEVFGGRLGIRLTTKKTGRELWVPFTREFQAVLETWEKQPAPFLGGIDAHNLAQTWAYERDHNPRFVRLRGLTMHGLRATAVVRLRRAGTELPQIADCVGMSEQMVRYYCRLSDQRENALAAVVNLEARRESKARKA